MYCTMILTLLPVNLALVAGGLYCRILRHDNYCRMRTRKAGPGLEWLEVGNGGPGGYMRTLPILLAISKFVLYLWSK